MELIEPKVELWIPEDTISHVCRCARVCYASEYKDKESDKKLYSALIKSGHLSVLRHTTTYYMVDCSQEASSSYNTLISILDYCLNCHHPYIKVEYIVDDKAMYVAVNGQSEIEPIYSELMSLLNKYGSVIAVEKMKKKCPSLVRYTFCITTQISTAREYLRHSPQNVSEQSTRYIKIGGKVEPAIVKPWWMLQPKCNSEVDLLYFNTCEDAFRIYDALFDEGMKPEDARGVLPLDTATKIVMTNTFEDWQKIIGMRYYGTTGRPHPNAAIIAKMIKDELDNN